MPNQLRVVYISSLFLLVKFYFLNSFFDNGIESYPTRDNLLFEFQKDLRSTLISNEIFLVLTNVCHSWMLTL